MRKLGVLLVVAALVLAYFLVFHRDPPPTEVLLARYEFRPDRPPVVFGIPKGDDRGIHWFADGWTKPQEYGVWIVGKEAKVYLYLLGKECVLTTDFSTLPDLAKAGQHLTIQMNGEELGRFPLGAKRVVKSCRVPVPDSVIRQGLNEVVFRADRHRPISKNQDGKTARPLSILIRSLKVRALLDEGQQDRWQRLCRTQLPDSDWTPVEFPNDAAQAGGGEKRKRPDILMLLLDAARPDHFSCYGYSRPTTPIIDELAKEGTVFRNTFSTAAFTLAAMPSLLTGYSWRDHELIKGDRALPGSFVTLAEVLQKAGYLTMAISANACFSAAFGLHQGFDEFVSTWKEKKIEENPEYPEERFLGRLAEGLGPEPVFAFLHLLPPHQPYEPGKAHNLWVDPDYQGTVVGSNEVIRDLDLNKRTWNEADRQQLIALYDGNLHRIDASVGRILRGWKALERDRELLLIVLSDHGEAFGEHGRFSHNSTVYDEMTRISLIFHPARLCKPLEGLEHSLLSITDVMPLVLHLIGVPPSPGSNWPTRFMKVLADPGAKRFEVMPRNCFDTLALRTDRYLAITDGWGRQELYDMSSDPMARNNLRTSEPDRYSEMIGKLRAILQGKFRTAEPINSSLSAEDLENLKKLGYIK